MQHILQIWIFQKSCYRGISSTTRLCWALWIYTVSVRLPLTEVNVKNVRVCGSSPCTALVEMGASHHMFGLKSAFRSGFSF